MDNAMAATESPALYGEGICNLQFPLAFLHLNVGQKEAGLLRPPVSANPDPNPSSRVHLHNGFGYN